MAVQQETEPAVREDPFFEEDDDPNALVQGEDGVYRWRYDMELRHNAGFLLLLIKMILIPSGAVFLGILLLSLRGGTPLRTLLMAWLILVGVLGLVALIIYFCQMLMAKISDNSYVLCYEMDENGVALAKSGEAGRSVFRTVKTVRVDRENNCIRLNSWFLYNLIYCREEDFDFVAEYIVSRCENAWIR